VGQPPPLSVSVSQLTWSVALISLGEFTFRPITEADFELLHRWLNAPHVAKWWDGPLTLPQVREKYQRKLAKSSEQNYIVLFEGHPLGYVGVYRAAEVGDGWWPGEASTTVGIDQFIGHPNLVNQGLGARFLRYLTDWLLSQPNIERVIVDPNPKNLRAIRCYRKAGFRDVGLIDTPDGPALLMEKGSV
jgi:RimJ/RimL family protein N-acetyltransferase